MIRRKVNRSVPRNGVLNRLVDWEPLEDRRLLTTDIITNVAHYGPEKYHEIPLYEGDSFDHAFDVLARGGTLDYGEVFSLQSKPDSNFTIYLDFDGHVTENTVWNSNYGISSIVTPPFDQDGDPTSFSQTELARIKLAWAEATEDFAAFDINVTTRDPGLDALIKSGGADATWGARAVITDDVFADCGCGGHAFLTSFNDSVDTPTFVYNQGPGVLALTVSHEVGHMLGLSHDGNSAETYYPGHGSADTSWGPIMGAPFNENVTQWSPGDYFDANNGENDLNIITSDNGFGYRTDDFGDDFATAESLDVSGSTSLHAFGIIERSTDLDVFSFESGGGNVSFNIDPLAQFPNLDVWAGLYDSSGSLVAQSNSTTSLSATLTNIPVSPGTYFLKIDGVGSNDVYNVGTDSVVSPNPAPWQSSDPTGYSDYASLGQYAIDGTIPAAGSDTFSIVATDAVKIEGAGGQVPLTFTVTRAGLTGSDASVDFELATHVPGAVGDNYESPADASDFAAGTQLAGTLNFAANETTKTLTWNVTGDGNAEDDEYFDILLSNPSSGWQFENSRATGIILSDEASFGVIPIATTDDVFEGPYDGALVRWRQVATASGSFDEWALDNVSLANSTFGDDFDPNVDFANWSQISNGAANNIFGGTGNSLFFTGTPDRWATSIFLNAQPGALLTFDMIFGDGNNGGENADNGDDVALEYSLDNGSNWSVITILDTEDYTSWTTIQVPLPADIDTNPPGEVKYLVAREGGSSLPATVNWSVDGTGLSPAADADDFAGGVFPNGQIAFGAGESTAEIVVSINGDNDFESNELFNVRLDSVAGNGTYTINAGQAVATGIIVNDDVSFEINPGPQLRWRQIDHSNGNFDEWGLDNVSVAGSSFADDFDPDVDNDQWSSIVGGTVNSNFGGGSNSLFFTGDNDRVAVSQRVSTQPGDMVTFDFIYGDDNNGGENPEPGDNVVFEHSLDGVNWTLVNTYDVTLYTTWTTLQESVPTSPPLDMDEGSGGGSTVFTFNVMRVGPTLAENTVSWQVGGGSTNPADAGDFAGGVLPSGSITFGIGEMIKSVDVLVAADAVFEADETFVFNVMGNTTGAVATIRNDDLAPSGDFNGDGSYNCSDIDDLTTNVAGQTGDLTFDLTADGLLDQDDVAAWLAIAGSVNLPSGNPYLYGDANLDGGVDVTDFGVWNTHKFTSGTAWCSGDFSADGTTDVSDFNFWNMNKFQSSDAATVEPADEIAMANFVVQSAEDEEEARQQVIDRVFAIA